MKVSGKLIGAVVAGVLAMGVIGMTLGNNEAGYRTVVQYPTGTMMVKFSPGPYLKLFGSATEYNDVVTMDFDQDNNPSGATIDQPGVSVRYRDGGMGTIYGKARFNLPSDRETMLLIHTELRGNNGVAHKLIKSVATEAINQTAGLMTSKEGYDTKRATFTQWARVQVENGLYKTTTKFITDTDQVTGKVVRKEVPVIATIDGMPTFHDSDMKKYGITVGGFQLNNPTFEAGTLAQIAKERTALMDIVTARADAEKAKALAITAEAKGKADVMTERYSKLVLKEAAVVQAEQAAAVAEIKASQLVTVASLAKDEAVQYKEMQAELKEANILEGEGLAEKKRLIMEADGALEQKLQTYRIVNANYAEALGKQKQVPEIQFGVSGDNSGGNNATALIEMLTAKTAKELSLTTGVK